MYKGGGLGGGHKGQQPCAVDMIEDPFGLFRNEWVHPNPYYLFLLESSRLATC